MKKKDHPQSTTENDDQDEVDPKSCDAQLIERIENEIIENGEKITFADIAGLHHAAMGPIRQYTDEEILHVRARFNDAISTMPCRVFAPVSLKRIYRRI